MFCKSFCKSFLVEFRPKKLQGITTLQFFYLVKFLFSKECATFRTFCYPILNNLVFTLTKTYFLNNLKT